MSVSAGPIRREDALTRMGAESFDVLVVGGGITGAGVALDAATRGMKVALVEGRDFAEGTSSRSTKLIHGGLRYLEQKELGLMHEALTERDRLRRLAPNLVRPIPFLLPRWSGGSRKAGIGLWIYDLLAGLRMVKLHRRVSSDEAADMVPATARGAEGYLYYDSQTDDVRLTLAVLTAARRAGAVVSNHLRVVDFLDVAGRATGALAVDRVTGDSVTIRASEVVNATGVWADDLRRMEEPDLRAMLRPSKGIHILIPKHKFPITSAILIPAADRRLLFAIPWRSSILVGTTDTMYDGPLDAPTVEPEEVRYLLNAVNSAFDCGFESHDVVGAFAGLRPLLDDVGRVKTRDLSRKHTILRGPKGVITVTGGKLTTYRLMAEEVVDLISSRQGRETKSVTRSVRLSTTDHEALRLQLAGTCGTMSLPEPTAEHLLFSYGDAAPAVLDMAREMQLAEPVVEGLPYLWAEVIWAVRNEMAVTVSDILARRTRISLEDRAAGVGESDKLIQLLANETSLPAKQIGLQVQAHLGQVRNERGSDLEVDGPRHDLKHRGRGA